MLILILLAGILDAFVAPQYGGPGMGIQPSRITVTIKKIQDCTEVWRSECAHLDFKPLDGIEKRDLTQRLPASASEMPPVVCEEDATAEHCTRVHWNNEELPEPGPSALAVSGTTPPTCQNPFAPTTGKREHGCTWGPQPQKCHQGPDIVTGTWATECR